jgi:endonuclease/exonuclease/phosphatase family metal-dependent hydrolase
MAFTLVLWNLRHKAREDLVNSLVAEAGAQVVVLLEEPLAPDERTAALDALGGTWRCPQAVVEHRDHVRLYTRLPEVAIRAISGGWRYAEYALNLPDVGEVLLVAAHLPDRRNSSLASANMQCAELAGAVRAREADRRHNRTIVVGDLNLDPWDDGIVGASGFHAMMTRSIAEKGTRVVNDRQYPFFYNPMWAHLGDRGASAPGTYYWRHAEQVCFHWHAIDQVLVRPALLGALPSECTQIVTRVGQTDLLKADGTPDGTTASDHLPLVVRLSVDYDA